MTELRIDGPHSPSYTREVAAAFAEAVRVLNHATRSSADGLESPADVCAVVGDVQAAVGALPQLLHQLAEFLLAQAAAGRLGNTEHPDGALWGRISANDLVVIAGQADSIEARLRMVHNDLADMYVKDADA